MSVNLTVTDPPVVYDPVVFLGVLPSVGLKTKDVPVGFPVMVQGKPLNEESPARSLKVTLPPFCSRGITVWTGAVALIDPEL